LLKEIPMSTIDTIKTPNLHSEWKAAKKATKDAAGKAKEAAAYTALEKELKRDFGPGLDTWHLGFPDAAKLAMAVLALQETITAYNRSISSSELGPDRRKILTQQLDRASRQVEEHYRLARKALTGGDDAAKLYATAASKASINAEVQTVSLRSAIQHGVDALQREPLDVKMVEWECSRVEALLNGAVKTALAQAREVHLKSQKWLDEHKEELASNPAYKATTLKTAALLTDLRDTAKVYDQGFKAVAALKKAVADGKARVATPVKA
jgi:hypothetical protein